MYCKNCGELIDDDSKFCRYCGTNQESITETDEPEQEQPKQESNIVEEITSKVSSRLSISNKPIIVYLIWILIHLTLLLVASEGAL